MTLSRHSLPHLRQLRPVALACCALVGLAVGGLAMAQKNAAVAKPSKAQLVADLAATLQACSYDGSPLAFSPPDLSKGGGTGKQVVAEIMKYTGLPANFVVVEGKVPNAAAVIMQGPDQVPRRVIAYNPAFMGQVIEATKSNNWAPVSIMAHEIGHHLSGHTIVPGGSQPPIELESDKFSGFVLYKMGAPLADAQRAIASAGTRHPGCQGPGTHGCAHPHASHPCGQGASPGPGSCRRRNPAQGRRGRHPVQGHAVHLRRVRHPGPGHPRPV